MVDQIQIRFIYKTRYSQTCRESKKRSRIVKGIGISIPVPNWGFGTRGFGQITELCGHDF
jgi:hypothetical protein